MNTPKPSYIELRFPMTKNAEIIQGLLSRWTPCGMMEEDEWWTCCFSHEFWEENSEAIRNELTMITPMPSYEILTVEGRNWNEEWERSIRPVRVSDRVLITPSWHSIQPAHGRIVLIIDPKMSFGTGFHATTRLMIRLMERVIRGGERVLDVGTGTGILLIAAMKFGAAHATGVDVDEWSSENARENLSKNDITTGVDILHGSIEVVEGTFDVICSNITRNDNRELMSSYAEMIETGGSVLLSGFYTDDAASMVDRARSLGFQEKESTSEDEWAAIHFTKT